MTVCFPSAGFEGPLALSSAAASRGESPGSGAVLTSVRTTRTFRTRRGSVAVEVDIGHLSLPPRQRQRCKLRVAPCTSHVVVGWTRRSRADLEPVNFVTGTNYPVDATTGALAA